MNLKRIVVLLATLAGVVAGTASPALAIDNYPTYPLWDGLGRVGSAHIQRVSGHTWDIAVRDERTNGHEICVRISPASPGPYIYYCDRTSSQSDSKAQHYRISYPWYKADLCEVDGGIGCEQYIYKDPND